MFAILSGVIALVSGLATAGAYFGSRDRATKGNPSLGKVLAAWAVGAVGVGAVLPALDHQPADFIAWAMGALLGPALVILGIASISLYHHVFTEARGREHGSH